MHKIVLVVYLLRFAPAPQASPLTTPCPFPSDLACEAECLLAARTQIPVHMLPRVAVIGRPNVGKSALFNRLSGTNAAIVYDTPGVTRDRLYVRGFWGAQEFLLIDTGGLIKPSALESAGLPADLPDHVRPPPGPASALSWLGFAVGCILIRVEVIRIHEAGAMSSDSRAGFYSVTRYPSRVAFLCMRIKCSYIMLS